MRDAPSQANLFRHLNNPSLEHELAWLRPLRSSVSRIANFGCWKGDEPFALLGTLGAIEVTVIEIDKNYLANLEKKIADFSEARLLDRCSITPVLGDMTSVQLRGDYYDLAYCDEVLYSVFEESEQNLQVAIDKMISVVRSGGWIIAVETKIGAEVQEVENQLLSALSGQKIVQHIPVSDPIDISPLFEAAGLVKINLDGAPKWSYCYMKPNRPPNPHWS
jgi:hypothetical protein